jgi:hemerythrin-like domain-containing protein
VHVWLREQLEDLRDGIDDYFAGTGVLPRDLRLYCVTFCSALTRHHSGEDGGAFPVVADEFPELRAVISQLKTDHNQIDWMLGNLGKLLDSLPDEPDPVTEARVRAEVEGLAAIMETHFVYEEKKIFSALNALDVPQWRADRPAFLQTDH